MRDGDIIRMNQNRATNEALLYRQYAFLNTRMEAAETVWKASRLIDRIQWLLWPVNFLKVVDTMQLSLMKEHDEQMKAAVEKAKQPKIDIISPNGFTNGR